MGHRIHDDEPDTGEAVVRTLLAAECPRWADLPIEHLDTSGTDNSMWRVRTGGGSDVVVRLPRRPDAAAKVVGETEVLERLAASPLRSVVVTPRAVHLGAPHEVFPHHWSVLAWLDGRDAWTARHALADGPDGLAVDLARAVLAIRELRGIPAPVRVAGNRGGPIEPLVQRLEAWLDHPRWQAAERIDVDRVRRLGREALAVPGPEAARFVHGDLLPGNLLVREGRLSAILDWGGAGHGDEAQDLAPAWSVLDAAGRTRFREEVGADEAAWVRARTFELEHAVGGVLYYGPRRHALGDVMARSLERILYAV